MVDLVDGRTAFELCQIQQRKDRSRITGLAVDNEGLRFYVGLDSGFVEEHRIVYGPSGCIARVCARRQASKKSVKSVCLLGGANVLAVLIEDGALLLCDLDQLYPVPLASAQNATMVASDPRYVSPCRFAVTVRSGLRRSRVDVYEISRDWGAEPTLLSQHAMQEEIRGMAWLGEDLVVASKTGYYSIRNNELKALMEPRAATLFIALPIPGLLTMLWEDSLAVICDVDGAAARPPLVFESRPLLLTQGGMCIVSVISSGGIVIYDQKTSKLVQRIPFNVENLFMADEEYITLHHADTPSGSTILLASVQSVWMLRPIAHEAQTIQLLKSGNVDAALELAENCMTESWAEEVFAQAGLLLLQDLQWKFALECFQRCTPAVFQPSQLFPLFPKWTKKWADQVCLKSYWGLHEEVTDLKFLAARHVPNEDDRSDLELGTSGRELQEEIVAQNHIANYFLKVRDRPNVDCIEGIDTLIIHLLSSTASLAKLESFVQTEHKAVLEDVRSHLVRQQQFVVLAILSWKKGDFEEALTILRDLTFNKCHEMKAKTGSVRQANGKQERVSTFYAACILTDTRIRNKLIEEHLQWLVEQSPSRFLYICQICSLSPSIILGIISESRLRLKFRYLHYIVHTSSHPTQDGRHHTELALVLSKLLEEHSDDFDTHEQKLPFMFASDDNYYQYPDCQLSQSQANILHFDTTLKLKMIVSHSEPPKGFFDPDELNVLTGQELRDILQRHLLLSKGYDAVRVLHAIEDTCLYEEQVILHCRLQDHVSALKLLSVSLRDIHAAIRYCKLYAGSEGFIKLLDMLLKPGDDKEPFFADAVQVLNAESGSLDPMRVLDALSESMPLTLAYPTLVRMLRERTHRRRQTKITSNLHKLQNVLYKAQKYDLESGVLGRVYVDVDTECALCRKPLGGRIFYKYPSGATVCGMCQRERQHPSSQTD